MTKPTPLTDAALARLRALAAANQLPPERIALVSTEEQEISLSGDMRITVEAQQTVTRYAGEGRGQIDKGFRSRVELQNYVEQLLQNFRRDPAWQAEIQQDLEQLPGKGWASVTQQFLFEDKRQLLAATEPCPTCAGKGAEGCERCQAKGQLLCQLCDGQGQEWCGYCQGTGRDPNNQENMCNYCSGQRLVVCRQCRGQRTIACPSCKGRGHIVCVPCEGKTMITEAVQLDYIAQLDFKAGSGAAMPGALRRAIDRAGGLAALGKGHATIEITPPTDNQREDLSLHYTATLPVAEMVIDFAGKKAKLASFGLKQVLLEVPPFLDMATAKARKLLAERTKQAGDLSPLRQTAVLENALTLVLAGQYSANALLRRQPIGLSRPVATEVMRDAALVLKKQTQLGRVAGLVASVLAALGMALGAHLAGVFAGLGTLQQPLELLWPLGLAGLVWLAQGAVLGLVLRHLHPQQKVKLLQPSARTGWLALAIFLTLYLGCLWLLPEPPLWLAALRG